MALDRLTKVNIIIHSFAAAAAAWSGAWAMAPVVGPVLADTVGLTFITVAMAGSLSALFGKNLDQANLWSFGSVALGWAAGNAILKAAWSLIPIYGSAVNATITFGLHEAIGWGLYLIFEEGGDPTKMSLNEIKDYVTRGKEEANKQREKYDALRSKLSPSDRKEVEGLEKKLADRELSQSEQDDILKRIENIFSKY